MSCIALILIFSQDVIYKFIGTSFQEGKYLFPFLVFSPVCYTLAETTGIGINISKKTYLHFCVYSVSIIVNFCACKMMIPVLGIIGAGIAVSLSSISMFITKTLFGQYFLKTINSWYKTAYALTILLTVTFAQILLKNSYKYLIYIGSMIILCVIFKENIMNLIRLLFYICKDKAQLSRHHNQQQQ